MMGVYQTHYVMYGVKITQDDPEWPSDDDTWDEETKWGKALCGSPDAIVHAACDTHMSEPSFYVVGDILARGGQGEGVELQELDLSTKNISSIHANLEQFFGLESFSKMTPGVYAFTNWS